VLAYVCDDGKVVLRFRNLPHKTPQPGVLTAPSREFSLVCNPDTFPDLAEYVAETLFPRDPSAPAYPDGFLSLPAGCHLSRP
jgi:hypothetical protein